MSLLPMSAPSTLEPRALNAEQFTLYETHAFKQSSGPSTTPVRPATA